MGNKQLKHELVTKLNEYLTDVGFPPDGFEIVANLSNTRGYNATVTVFCSGADRLIKEWELVSEDYADEAQDMLTGCQRVEVTLKDVSPDSEDFDTDGVEVYRTSAKDTDEDDDLDSEEEQYEEEGLSIAYDESELGFNDDFSDDAIDDLTLKDILNSIDDEDDIDYNASDEEWEDFYGRD